MARKKKTETETKPTETKAPAKPEPETVADTAVGPPEPTAEVMAKAEAAASQIIAEAEAARDLMMAEAEKDIFEAEKSARARLRNETNRMRSEIEAEARARLAAVPGLAPPNPEDDELVTVWVRTVGWDETWAPLYRPHIGVHVPATPTEMEVTMRQREQLRSDARVDCWDRKPKLKPPPEPEPTPEELTVSPLQLHPKRQPKMNARKRRLQGGDSDFDTPPSQRRD